MARCAPPVTAAASPPTHHTITCTSCMRHSALVHHHTASHCQAVRLELLAEKAALHADRVMKDQAVTPPCSRLQAAAPSSHIYYLCAPLRPLPCSLPPSLPCSPSLSQTLPHSPLARPRSPSLLATPSLLALPRVCRLCRLYRLCCLCRSLSAFGCLLFSRGTRSTPRHRCRLPLSCSRP